jgi:hypothetical protein
MNKSKVIEKKDQVLKKHKINKRKLEGWVRMPPKTQRGQGRFISSKNTKGLIFPKH